MRANPLQEILEAAMKADEPLVDSEWPAADHMLLQVRVRPNTAPTARPIVAARR